MGHDGELEPVHELFGPTEAGSEVQRTINTSGRDNILDGLDRVLRTGYNSRR